MKVAVLGLGYVGCVTAACLSHAGHSIVGIDPSPNKYLLLQQGLSPVMEPGLAEMVSNGHAAGKLTATPETTEIANVDIALVCVGTPSGADGQPELASLKAVAEDIGREIPKRSSPLTIVLRSTVLPGTTTGSFIPWLEEASGLKAGEDFHVAFCPEFLRESAAISDFFNPPYTVVGPASDEAARATTELLSFIGHPVHVVPVPVAEALKFSCNAFHAFKVAFANELARVFAAASVDPRQVMNLFVQDRELNISPRYLRPGFAFGGSCLPKDVRALQYLSTSVGVSAPLLQSLTLTNEAHIDQVADTVVSSGATRVALLGLTFKPATDDLRESPFVKLAAQLRSRGVDVVAYDPIIRIDRLVGANRTYMEAWLPDLGEVLVDDVSEAIEGVDMILLGTNSADVSEKVLAGPSIPVIDLSGALAPGVEQALRTRKTTSKLGLSYVGAAW